MTGPFSMSLVCLDLTTRSTKSHKKQISLFVTLRVFRGDESSIIPERVGQTPRHREAEGRTFRSVPDQN